MTLTGSDEAQQRAKSLIEELLTEKSNTQEYGSAQRNTVAESSQKEEIDWANFDWTKANEEYVCFAHSNKRWIIFL